MSSSEDAELKRLMNKKLRELASKQQPAPRAPSAREVLLSRLYDRGDEVLAAAEAQYPEQTRAIVEKLAELFNSGRLSSNISGGELLYLFRRLGLNISIETSIKVEQHGKFVDLSEKLKGNAQ